MNQQERFEAHYADQHGVPVETMTSYRMGDTYRLPGIASHYRTFKAAEDGLLKDAERYRFLRDTDSERGICIINVGSWTAGATCIATTFYSAEHVDEMVDDAMRALEAECQHDWCQAAISSTPDYCTRCGDDKPEQEATDARNAKG